MRRLLALVLWAGCYAPHPSAGAPCADGVCPEGLVCSPATQTCERAAIDAAVHDGTVMRDAMIDARPDAPRDAMIVPDAAVGPTLVQQATGYTALGTSASATLPATPITGHLLVMIGSGTSGGVTVSGGGATWTQATSSLTNSNEEIYFGVTNGTSATVTITLATNAPVFVWVGEWSGVQATNILDKATSTSGLSSPASAGSIAPTNAKDLVLFAASAYAPNAFGTPAPETWTPLAGITQNEITQREWYLVQSAAMSHAPAVSLNNPSAGWDAAIAAFRAQ